MAIFSLSIRTISRDPKRTDSRIKKSSAVAAVAYVCTTSLTDQRTGTTYNYAHGNQKKIATTVDLGLYLPGGKTVKQERDRLGEYSDFWSKVELKEKRKDSRTARTIIAALPIEMTRQEHIQILEKYREFLADKYGLATQIAIHYDSPHNPHAHIIMPTREVSPNGELGTKIRVLDSQKTAHPHKAQQSRGVFSPTFSRLLWERKCCALDCKPRGAFWARDSEPTGAGRACLPSYSRGREQSRIVF